MKGELEISLINNEKYKNEWINEMITTLETMEKYKDTIYNRLNNSLSNRIQKLSNLKSRINRINQIITTFPNLNKAITLKSKFHYPKNEDSYYKPTIIDKIENIPNSENKNLINEHTMNSKEVLGAQPVYKKQDITLYFQFQNLIPIYNDIANELGNIVKDGFNNGDDTLSKIDPILNYTTSDFSFNEKQKINVEKKNNIFIQDNNLRDSVALGELMKDENIKKKPKKPKIIQQAPKSIRDKQKIKQYVKKKNILKQNSNIQVNLPTNLGGLGNITDFDTGNYQIEDYDKINENDFDEEEDDIEEYNQEILNEEDYDLVDYIEYKQTYKKDNPNTIMSTTNIQPTVTTSTQPTTTVTSTVQNSNIPVTQPVTTGNIPLPPQIPPSGNIPLPPPIPQSNIPKPPPIVPPIPNNNIPTVPVVPTSGNVPIAPPIPKAPAVPQVVSPPPGGNIPLPPPLLPVKIDQEAIKRNQEKAEKAKKDAEAKKKKEPHKLSMQEEIALKMGKLKKVGDVKVEQKVDNKKAAPQESMMDLLKKQINLRFKNINRHKEEDSSEEDEDSD